MRRPHPHIARAALFAGIACLGGGLPPSLMVAQDLDRYANDDSHDNDDGHDVPAWSLTWTRDMGADDCIAQPALIRAVSTHLGSRPSRHHGDDTDWVHVVGQVGGSITGHAVHLIAYDAGGHQLGTRQLDDIGTDCRQLDDAVALLIVMMIERAALRLSAPEQAGGGFGESRPPPPTTGLAAGGVPPIAASSVRADRPGERFLQLSSGLQLGTAMTPDLAAAISVGLAGQMAGWRLAAQFTYLPGDDTTQHGGHTAFDWIGLGLAVCPRLASGRTLSLFACLAGEVGRLTARGDGYDRDFTSAHVLGNVALGLRVAAAVAEQLRIEGHLDGVAPTTRPRFYVRDGSTSTDLAVHRPDAVGLRIGIQLAYAVDLP